MVLFIHLKIILLQYFQFSIFSNKWYPNRPLIDLKWKLILSQKKEKGGKLIGMNGIVRFFFFFNKFFKIIMIFMMSL